MIEGANWVTVNGTTIYNKDYAQVGIGNNNEITHIRKWAMDVEDKPTKNVKLLPINKALEDIKKEKVKSMIIMDEGASVIKIDKVEINYWRSDSSKSDNYLLPVYCVYGKDQNGKYFQAHVNAIDFEQLK